nr:hypothetical protein [uncultured Shinella sp.]
MRRRILMASAAFALVSASPAAAQEISPAGAESLQQRLTQYLPKDIVDAGVVTVKAASSFYEVRFDPTVLLDKAGKGKVRIEGLKPTTAYLRPQPEGTYRVEANETLDIKGTLPGQGAFTYLIDTMKLDGIYDPEILYLTSGEWSTKRIAFSSTTQQESVTASFGESAMRITSEKKAPGTIDIASTGVMKAFAETITGGPSGRVDIGADTLDIDVSMDGARYKVLQDLVFFVLENIKKDKLDPQDAARLKDLLRASLPVFDNLTETIKASNVTVGTDKGTFGADAVTYNIDMNGIGHSTRVGFGFGVEHPKPPAGVLPAEFAEALPERANFKVAVANLDLAGAVHYLIDHADFTKTEPLTEEQNKALGRIVLPNGAMTVEFEDVSAASPIYDLQVSGKMTVYPDQQDRRSADITITMRDFDKTITYLQRNAGKVPQFGQASFGLLMMKGLARKGGGDAQIWDLTVGEDGKVLINGQPLPFQQ